MPTSKEIFSDNNSSDHLKRSAGPALAQIEDIGRLCESHSYPSYSQAGEDRILYYMFEHCKTVNGLSYVDVGASTPAGHNNTYLFYSLGGSGVLVDADLKYLPAYALVRPGDKVEHAAIVPKRMWNEGGLAFYLMEDQGWSTVSPDHAAAGRAAGKTRGDQMKVVVPCMTINELLERHYPDGHFDILSLDIEGVDTEVIKEMDLVRFRPNAIIIENEGRQPGARQDIRELHQSDYILVADTVVNSIYVSKEFYSSFNP